MPRFLRPIQIVLCILLCGGAAAWTQAPAPAPTGKVGMDYTADELMLASRNAYNAGKWEKATKLYEEFLSSFSKAVGVEPLIPRIRYDLAFAYLQLQKYSDALGKITEALSAHPPLSALQIHELTFWKGVCEMQGQESDKARATLEAFIAFYPPLINPILVQQDPSAAKVPEAKLLIGSTFLLQDKFKEAADFLGREKPGMISENRGRATVLELYALLQAGEKDRALAVVVEEFPRVGELTQLVAFQTLALQLGSELLEAKEYRKSIICLQRIWSADRVLTHQEARETKLEEKLAALEANPKSDPYQKFLALQTFAKIKREIENFAKIQNYDAALRLRLATAYQAMKRYREAGLILEAMLVEMPPSPIVEAASVNLVQCWFQTERWPKVVEAAGLFEKKFPKSKSVPLVRYLQGIAEQKDLHNAEAIAAFDAILKNHPDSEYAARALFMKGFTYLLAEQNPDAVTTFEEFQKTYAKHELAESAAYWKGMGYSLDKQYPPTREAMDDYLRKYKDGSFVSLAKFRKAYAAQQLMDFSTSIKELNTLLREHPGNENESEALVLLGDAYMNEGEMDYGIAAFKRINPTDTRFFEEGWFKVGKALKLMENYSGLRDHMMQFRTEHPKSPRVAEALYNVGWVYRQEGDDDKARQVYWDAIKEYGNDPEVRSVEDLFPALAKLYKGEEGQAQYQAKLRDLAADREGKPTLAMRALWAQANPLKRSQPDKAAALLVEASSLVNVESTNPMLMADFADALLQSGQEEAGEKLYKDMVKWNPRAPQKDRAFAALGMRELKRGNEKAALQYFTRFEKETLGSILYGKILLAKASLEQDRGQFAEARTSLDALLANSFSSGQEKAEALYRMGDLYMKEGKPQLAVPYFQRIYIMHGRWRDWVAKAYLRSGEAFENLKDLDAARKSYEELTSKEELADFAETATAKQKLSKLGTPKPS